MQLLSCGLHLSSAHKFPPRRCRWFRHAVVEGDITPCEFAGHLSKEVVVLLRLTALREKESESVGLRLGVTNQDYSGKQARGPIAPSKAAAAVCFDWGRLSHGAGEVYGLPLAGPTVEAACGCTLLGGRRV